MRKHSLTLLLFFALPLLLLLVDLTEAQTIAPGQDLYGAVGSEDVVVLELEKGVYTLSNEIAVSIGRTITIKGAGKKDTIIDCNHQNRIAHVAEGHLILSDLTVKNCSNTMGGAIFVEDGQVEGTSVVFRNNDAPGFVFDGWAGAILSLGSKSSLKFVDSDFVDNIAGVSGAVWVNSGTSSWKKCLFDSNISRGGGFGGAIIPEGDSVNEFEDCEFVNNYGEYGGAVDDGSTAISSFKRCYFHNNRALYGGGYYAFSESQATFEDCLFENETSANTGGAAEISSTCRPVFRNCTFQKNIASSSSDISITGGALTQIIDCKFGKVATDSPAAATHIGIQAHTIVQGCEFEGGSALQGGSIYLRCSQAINVTISDSVFKRNTAVIQGGAIYLEGFLDESANPNIKIKDCTFENNKAGSTGGAISATGSDNFKVSIEGCSFKDNEGGSGGGAVTIQKEMTGVIQDCTFEKNTAATGGAIFVSDTALVTGKKTSFNSNSARFGGSLAQNLGGRFEVEDSEIRNGKATFQGGAFFASNLATGCSQFENVKFIQNEASVGGGGFYFAERSPPSCKSYKKAGDSLGYCVDCEFVRNTAGYGPDYATGASTLKSENKEVRKLRPSEHFSMYFSVVDYYGQTLQGFIDMDVKIKVSNETVLRGEQSKQPERDGTVSFEDLRWGVKPGDKAPIKFYSEPTTTELSYTVDIENCNEDEVLYVEPEGEKGEDGETEVIWYCLEIQDPDEIAQNLTYAGVAVVLFLSFLILGLLIWKQEKKPIHNASPFFCFIIVIGVIFATVSVAMWTKADDAMCVLRGWLLAIGTSLIFGSLFVREWRMLWIFKNAKVERRILTNLDLAKGLAVIVSLNLIVLIVWTAVAPPYRVSDIKIARYDEITYECDVSFPSSVFIIMLIVLQALLLAFDCVVAFLLRNIPSSFNESKHVAFTIYNSAIMMAVAIVLVIVFNDDKTSVLVIIALTVLFGCFAALMVLFVPKIFLSFLSKAALVKRLQEETEELQQELLVRDRQISDMTKTSASKSDSQGDSKL